MRIRVEYDTWSEETGDIHNVEFMDTSLTEIKWPVLWRMVERQLNKKYGEDRAVVTKITKVD